MSLLMAERIDRPASLVGPSPAHAGAPERDEGLGGGLTLDDAIVGAWEGLAAQVVVPCPLCGGALRPHGEHEDTGGRCGDCATTVA
ncbi:MAG TPA: hypothetical protein VK506_10255 [Conexibacter sp.]|nr:hypothetical protein [Conexibacter sp.]